MICLTRFSSLAVSTRPQNETVSLKYFALQQRRHDSEAATSRVEHLEEKVQQNLTRQLYGANGQSPADGNTILYASGRNILITRNDGQEARVLTSVPGRAFWLRCAPDGSRFRFTVVDSATRATSLWEFTLAGNKL